MPATHPVVVYGASGYTGRLVCEYLRDLGTPFTAVGRDADRVRHVLDTAVPGVETVPHEVLGVEHTVEALTELLQGAQVMINTVGPFASLGGEVVEACLATGCHYLDTTGEQDWLLDCEERFHEGFAEAGLTLVPGMAQMYTTGEIAAQIALEEPGYDTLDIVVLWKGAPTTASTETIFTNLMSTAHKLEGGEYVPWGPIQGYEVSVPDRHQTALTLPWGGTSHPVWFKRDPRVQNVQVTGGVYNRDLMTVVRDTAQMVEEQIKPIEDKAEREKQLAAVAAQFKADMPPRETPLLNRSMDSVHATGPVRHAHVWIPGNCNYKQTGLLNAYAAMTLVRGKAPLSVGLSSGCQAFGHLELLGCLQDFGLVGEPRITREG